MDANEKKEVIKKRFQEIAMSGGGHAVPGGEGVVEIQVRQIFPELSAILKLILRLFRMQTWGSAAVTPPPLLLN